MPEINRQHKSGIGWSAQPDLLWLCRVSVPFTYALSKNHIYALRATGHVELRQETRVAQSSLRMLNQLSSIGTTWEIVKENPLLIVGIGQDCDGDAQVCSYCGRIQPLDCYQKSSEHHLGVGRECRECRSVKGGKSCPSIA